MLKKYMGGIGILLVAIGSIPLSCFFSYGAHLATYVINGAPALIWGLVLLLGCRRWKALGDAGTVGLGVCYGFLGAVLVVATLSLMVNAVQEPALGKNPYDAAAYGILSMVSLILLLALLLWDLWKHGEKRLGMRIVTAMVVFLPAVLVIGPIMAYFERVLSQYVS